LPLLDRDRTWRDSGGSETAEEEEETVTEEVEAEAGVELDEAPPATDAA